MQVMKNGTAQDWAHLEGTPITAEALGMLLELLSLIGELRKDIERLRLSTAR